MLHGLGVNLIEHDIDKSKARNKEMKSMGGRGVPFILIGNKKISGYAPGTMINALDKLK